MQRFYKILFGNKEEATTENKEAASVKVLEKNKVAEVKHPYGYTTVDKIKEIPPLDNIQSLMREVLIRAYLVAIVRRDISPPNNNEVKDAIQKAAQVAAGKLKEAGLLGMLETQKGLEENLRSYYSSYMNDLFPTEGWPQGFRHEGLNFGNAFPSYSFFAFNDDLLHDEEGYRTHGILINREDILNVFVGLCAKYNNVCNVPVHVLQENMYPEKYRRFKELWMEEAKQLHYSLLPPTHSNEVAAEYRNKLFRDQHDILREQAEAESREQDMREERLNTRALKTSKQLSPSPPGGPSLQPDVPGAAAPSGAASSQPSAEQAEQPGAGANSSKTKPDEPEDRGPKLR